MSLKNQKGIVRYQGRDDIVCSYGIRDDGMQFYYLDSEGAVFKNGNRIATTALVEAVDPMVKASNVGVLDVEGHEVIPFNNRSIRPVNEDIILVEPATPTSESVNEAIKLKSDPLSAAKLVSTPALIKDKLNAQVGSEGRYLFNDQFSEATVCDINGNNLVNGESYSFIVSDGKNLYFSKNTADSEITNYSILPPEVQSNVTPAGDSKELNVSAVDVSKEVVEQALNSQAEKVQTDNVEMSEPNENSVQENTGVVETEEPAEEVTTEEVVEEPVQDTNLETGFEIPTVAVDTPSLPQNLIPTVAEDEPEETTTEKAVEEPVEEAVTEKEEEKPVEESVAEEAVEEPTEEAVTEEVEEPAEEVTTEEAEEVTTEEAEEVTTEEAVEEPVEEPIAEKGAEESVEEIAQEEVVEEAEKEKVESDDVADVQLNDDILSAEQNVVKEDDTDIDSLSGLLNSEVEEKVDNSDITEEDISLDLSDSDLQDFDTSIKEDVSEDISFDDDVDDDVFANSNVQIDHIDNDFMDNIDEDEKPSRSKDNIMSDVAKSMTAMINRIRVLEAELSEERARSDKLNSVRRTLIEKNQMLGKKAEAYKSKASSLGAAVAQTNSKKSLLENRVHEQKRVIEAQSQELQVLRPLLQGKEEVVGILADVQALLDQNAA